MFLLNVRKSKVAEIENDLQYGCNLSKINNPKSTQRKETMFSSERNLCKNFKQQNYLMINFTLSTVLS